MWRSVVKAVAFIGLLAFAASAGEVYFQGAADWEPPPLYHGNAFAPGGVGGAWWWVYEPLFVYLPGPGDTIPSGVFAGRDRMIPRLGVSYDDTPEAFVVHLRRNVVWHDGMPFTAKDVWCTFVFGYLKNWAIWNYLEAIEIPDDYTVVFRWKSPTPFAKLLIAQNVILWPYHIYGKWAERVDLNVPSSEEPNKTVTEELLNFKPEKPIGTGPFMLKEVTASDMLLLKFPDYWAADKVDFDGVKILRWTNNYVVWGYLLGGELDAGHPATRRDITEAILNLPGMRLATPTDLGGFCLAFNLRETLPDGEPNPFRELKFRQAIAYAIDRAELAEACYWAGLPITDYATGLLESMRASWGVTDEWMAANLTNYSYDPEKAARLLTELGYKKGPDGIWEDSQGNDLKFSLVCHAGYSDWVIAIDDIASQLKEFGIIIEPETRPGSIYWTSIRAGNFELCMEWTATSWGFAHPWAELRRTLHKDGDTAKTVDITAIDILGPDGQPVDTTALVDELGATFDLENQVELIKSLAWIHNENLLVLPFVEKRIMIFHREGVRVTGWPALDDPAWLLAPGGIERCYTTFMVEDVIEPVK
ncbi:MAG: ABC-type dipeptide/oligopeptide/nickel transport system, periplasmic component [Acetothermia bacterium 64_32]|nr:MAG: ABC-type dipeptide/oligopeptide/nickel transport system, periplasmic component [Acetothermia bacterium 64_32]